MEKVHRLEFNCPITGQPLYYIGKDKESKYYESEDRKIKYSDKKGWVEPILHDGTLLRSDCHFKSQVRVFKSDGSNWREYFKAIILTEEYFPIETTEDEFEIIRNERYDRLKDHTFNKWTGSGMLGSQTSPLRLDGSGIYGPGYFDQGLEGFNANFPNNAFIGLDSIQLPIIRSIASSTIGLDLVAVQPMGLPTGMLNYFDYKYSKIPSNVGVGFYDKLRKFFKTDNILVGDGIEEKTIYLKGGKLEIKTLTLFREGQEIAIRTSGIRRRKEAPPKKIKGFV